MGRPRKQPETEAAETPGAVSTREAAKKPRARRAAAKERKPIVRVPKPERARGQRKERRGVVVSTAMDKTIVVRVDTVKPHPRYKKVVRRSAKFHAHDEENVANVGDLVRIVETRPLSKTKHWRLAEVLEAAR
jgi:small subunit ribosomal protein S17